MWLSSNHLRLFYTIIYTYFYLVFNIYILFPLVLRQNINLKPLRIFLFRIPFINKLQNRFQMLSFPNTVRGIGYDIRIIRLFRIQFFYQKHGIWFRHEYNVFFSLFIPKRQFNFISFILTQTTSRYVDSTTSQCKQILGVLCICRVRFYLKILRSVCFGVEIGY